MLPFTESPFLRPRLAIVIPCYRVKEKIVGVVAGCLEYADYVIAVDDCCPEKSGAHLQEQCRDPRVTVVFHEVNQGVGGAMATGFEAALKTDADIVVKMDGDGQMLAEDLPRLVAPLITRRADFTKGNRFYDLHALRSMPPVRRFGNFCLTFLTKAASGHWQMSDPTNGYLAIRRPALEMLNLHLLDRRYFFEISLLVQLNVIRALVCDVPLPARYADEKSSLNPMRIAVSFPSKLVKSLIHRLWWRYFIYDINIGSVFMVIGSLLCVGGILFGGYRWSTDPFDHTDESAGTVALAMLPIILGFQMILQFLVFDTHDQPSEALSNQFDEKATGLLRKEQGTTAVAKSESSSRISSAVHQ
ncbi:MAG: glycosyltransferase family 2 protein [Chthoniobacteraceae bacterium]